MIKLVVTDIDGTIADKDANISQKVRNSINKLKAKGVKVVLATGRMFRAAYPVLEDLKLDTPIISYQGGFVKEFYGEQKVLYSKYTDKTLAYEVIDYFRSKNIHINVYVNDVLYVEKEDEYVKKYVENRNIIYKVVNDLKNLDINGIHKVLGIDKDPQKIFNATEELKEKYKNKLYIIRSTPHYCEVSNPEASKAAALCFLRDYWGFKPDEVLAIGDQDNDIDMIEAAGVGVSMGNGTPKLKEKADFITKSVDEDGFSYAMGKFCDV